MNKYQARIFQNGRIALFEGRDYGDAIEQGKEILVFCGGWSGGYARAFGAEKVPDYYNVNNGNDCFDCYAYDVKDKIFTAEQLTKFYRAIVTDGVKVYMKTGEPATSFFGGNFSDWDTKLEDYMRRFYANKTVTKEQFEKMRHQIDVEKTLRMVYGKTEKDKAEIQNAIEGYLH